MGPYAGVDFKLTLCPLQSRLYHIYHGHWATLCQSQPYPYARVDFIPQSGTSDLVTKLAQHSVRVGGRAASVKCRHQH